MLEILSGFYNSARRSPLKDCVRNLPLSGRYCDPRDSSVWGAMFCDAYIVEGRREELLTPPFLFWRPRVDAACGSGARRTINAAPGSTGASISPR
ncbi:hypothetical protein [Sphingopyxis sp. OAS728]|uniref:hypothetical protein n=1 Tax=Sphingopyxis sp. OAS728 TaxID=2663823 RepID=UPI00178B06DE|nr:hypothetical protein [Sphingopyxis sp. OAS728]